MTRAIAVGDLHLLYHGTERDAVDQLVRALRREPPDLLILGGDIYDLYRRDIGGATWSASEYTEDFIKLGENGTEVIYLAGNHDGYLHRHVINTDDYPFEMAVEYRTTLDGVPFLFTHGHKYEPQYSPLTDDLLSLTDDYAGWVADRLWQNRPLANNPLEQIATALVGPPVGYLDPDTTRGNEIRQWIIQQGVELETADDEWGVYGHTHVPFVDEDNRTANWGSMTGGQATYIEISEGRPQLRELEV